MPAGGSTRIRPLSFSYPKPMLPVCNKPIIAHQAVAFSLAGAIARLSLPRRLYHLRDHMVRAADNAALRLSEAGKRTLGTRRQHLEAAYAERQEVQSALALIAARGVEIPDGVCESADRLGGLVYGLLRSEGHG